jgi:hypothetical protein
VTLFKITPNALAGLKKLDLEIKFSWIYLYNIINKMAQIGKIFTSRRWAVQKERWLHQGLKKPFLNQKALAGLMKTVLFFVKNSKKMNSNKFYQTKMVN